MSAPTHIAFAELVYLLLLTTAGVALNAANGAVIALSSLLADLDTESSTLGKILPFVALPIERRFGHRTLTHSALFVLAFCVAALPLAAASRDLYVCLVIGYATHPFLDTMNTGGVELFYPFARVRCVFPFDANAPSRFRAATGSGIDRVLGVLFLAGCVPTFLISQQGHERFIRTTQRTVESAVRDYNELSMTHRVFADIRAHNLFTTESIEGRFEIAGAIDQQTLLFVDAQGELRSLGREHDAEYTAETVVCYPEEPVRTIVGTVELENQPLGALAEVCDPERRTYFFGRLVTREGLEFTRPSPVFSPVSGSGNALTLFYATIGDVRKLGLGNVVIDHGRVTLRSLVPPTVEPPTDLASLDSLRAFSVQSLSCALGASIAVHVSRGDTIRKGQLLLEIRPDSATQFRDETERARRMTLLETQRAELQALERRIAGGQEKLCTDSLELAAARRLHADGFISVGVLSDLERKLKDDALGLSVLLFRRTLLLKKIGLSSRDIDSQAPEGRVVPVEMLQATEDGTVHDVRRTARGKQLTITVVIRRWR